MNWSKLLDNIQVFLATMFMIMGIWEFAEYFGYIVPKRIVPQWVYGLTLMYISLLMCTILYLLDKLKETGE